MFLRKHTVSDFYLNALLKCALENYDETKIGIDVPLSTAYLYVH